MAAVLRDLIVGPGVIAIRLRQLDLDAGRWVILDQIDFDGMAKKPAQRLEPMLLGVAALGVKHRADVLEREIAHHDRTPRAATQLLHDRPTVALAVLGKSLG